MISEKRLKSNAVIIALVIGITAITKFVTLFIHISYNIVVMEVFFSFLLVITNGGKIRITKPFLYVNIIVLLLFGYSLIICSFNSMTTMLLLEFVMYATLPCFCLQYEFDMKRFRRTLLVIGLLYVAYLYFYALRQIQLNIMSINHTMDLSYTALIFLFAAMQIIQEEKKSVTKFLAGVVICSITYFMLFQSFNRGSLIAIVVYIALTMILKASGTLKRTYIILLISMMLIIVIAYFIPILEWLRSMASNYGLVFKPLNKILYQLRVSDNLNSGRDSLYIAALDLIKQNFGFAGGIGSYYLAVGKQYPHNILLEVGVEIGIPAAIFTIYLIVKALRRMLMCEQNRLFLLFLFCLSIPRLMVSSTIWENSFIWIIIMELYSNKSREI